MPDLSVRIRLLWQLANAATATIAMIAKVLLFFITLINIAIFWFNYIKKDNALFPLSARMENNYKDNHLINLHSKST